MELLMEHPLPERLRSLEFYNVKATRSRGLSMPQLRSLAKEIGKPKLLRIAKPANDIALFEITNFLGIDDEEKEIIFENLFQGDEKTRKEEGGGAHEEIYEKKEYN